MCAAIDESQDATTSNNMAAATPTVVVISSNSAVENIVAGLKGNGGPTNGIPEGQENIDATDLTREQWIKVLTSSSVLKAWKGQHEGGSMHINRAPCAGSIDMQGDLPEFEIADNTYIETMESKTSLEREMTLKAFTESGIQTALSGGAQDISFGFGGDFNWQNQQSIHGMDKESITAVHGFYNAERFLAGHGALLLCRVTLGGRLCTARELQTEEETRISDIKKDVRTQLNATIKGGAAGLSSGLAKQKRSNREDHHFQQASISRTSVETQGGNGLLASK
ncbi:MAG: hypothetical protein Q9188_007088 [Gyalolechia gomerana]